MDKSKFLNSFWSYIKDSNKILITSHENPDDDSISSVLSIYTIIKDKYPNKFIEIAYTSSFSKKWKSFKYFNLIKSVDDISNILNDYDLAIFLDSSRYHLFTHNEEKLIQSNCKKICIDHHKTDSQEFDLIYKDTSLGSNAEVIFSLFLQDQKVIDKDLARAVLLGILGDTGTFKYVKSDQANVFSVAKILVENGKIDIQDFKSQYERYSEDMYSLIREFISNSRILELPNWGKFMISTLDDDFVKTNNLDYGSVIRASKVFVSGLGISVDKVDWDFVIFPAPDNQYKIEIRSIPNSPNVRLIMQELEIGGGHDRAAGGTFKKLENAKAEEYLNLFLDWLKNNKPTIS